MLCDDDFICLWSLQTHPTITTSDASPSSESVSLSTAKNVWSNEKSQKPDPMQLLFRSHSHGNTDSGITSPNSQHNIEEELNLMDVSNDELRLRINGMLRKSTLDDEDKQCLQHLSTMIQQMDIFSQRSGPDSLNTTSSSDEPSSLELVKSRISDYSSASSSSSSRSANDNHSNNVKSLKSIVQTTNSRIVATVSPYNSSPQHQVPTNTPTDSPRKQRQAWQSNSLSESGVFVESDFLSDTSENNAYTQTDFEEETISTASRLFNAELQKLCSDAKFIHKVPAAQLSPNLSEQKRLQYYKERLELLESKVLIYESSGDIQAKRLADRLQREIQLEKQLRELQDRVEFLESENSTLEEEKCEFEEAENDTRLRLQRLEVELEILRQRNVELEMSREALSAKYKDCRSECLILRDDLSVSETQIRHLEEDKQKAKENLEFLHNTVWIILLYNALVVAPIRKQKSATKLTENLTMGNTESHPCFCANNALSGKCSSGSSRGGIIDEEISKVEVQCLRDQITCLQHQLKEMDARHYEAMEIADAHWHDLEANYKEREQTLMAKEMCLKQKINRLQDVLRDDARAADEKILCMEESEKELKSCIMRLTKEYRDLNDEYKCLCCEIEQFKEKQETLEDKQKPLLDALEQEKKANKTLRDEVNFMCKLQQETEKSNLTEIECLRGKLYDLKKETLHIEVTNSELREEVETLEAQIKAMVIREKENDDKIRVLTDELRNKEELCQKYEKQFDNPCDGSSLADELGAGPSKRHRREEVHDLKTATEGLVKVLNTLHGCNLPTERYFRCVALEVQKLAEKVLSTQKGTGDDKGKDKDNDKDTDKDTDKDKDTEKDEGKNIDGAAVLVVIEDVEDVEDLVKNPTTSNPPIDTVENIVTEQEPQNEPDRDTGGQENNTTIVGISLVPPFSLPRKSQNEPESDNEGEEKNTTIVGMALVPSFSLPEEELPSCSELEKKQICEVPSMLRKITLESSKYSDVMVTNLRKIRKRRRYKSSLISIHSRLRRYISLNSHKSRKFFDLPDGDDEEVQRTVSYESFKSFEEDVIECSSKTDAFTSTEIEQENKRTQTFTEKSESYVQVTDDYNAEKLMQVIPSDMRSFVYMLKSTAQLSNNESDECNMKIVQEWELNKEFRDGIVLLRTYTIAQTENNKKPFENYEDYVHALSTIQILKEIFKPATVPILERFETGINEQLMLYHTNQMESRFYCTIYVPVKRQMSFKVVNNAKKL
ncbi:myosin-2 heavy chain-like [Teleopsis dalmanni]|uniref:myosin-2 heavy chain-like n=1 Tax=Teleopsis dalmanni TaxID=139649 RepID=UPI0018CDA762|nr:myosin-2 heavy chain-like [Teleopsis dalmanni]